MTLETSTLRLNAADPIVTAMRDLNEGDVAEGVAVRQAVPRGHKLAIRAIERGEGIRKFGEVIGYAREDIAAGAHVHSHNLELGALHVNRDVRVSQEPRAQAAAVPATFEGIVRADGAVATRNYIGVLTTVNCSATVARIISGQFAHPGALSEFPNVDGVVALTHKTGCVGGTDDEAITILRRTLVGYATHANFAAVLVIGLGCEDNQMARLLGPVDPKHLARIHPLIIQEVGGTHATVKVAVDKIKSLLPATNDVRRTTVSASHLKVGLQCGGSDAFSAITANPALGAAVDLLVQNGGTAMLSETPEIYGAEHLLLRRTPSPQVRDKLIARVKWWESYAVKHSQSLDNNPSPGNKAGGISTIAEKSLGAVAKGGSTDVVEVYEYAEPVSAKGLVFMDTPGYDPVSATGQVAGGANLICFTTGRGSCFGSRPSPSLKLATNTPLYERMTDDMDINCGLIADGEKSVAEMGAVIFQRMLETASGRKTKSEELGYGEDEFAPWQFGATL